MAAKNNNVYYSEKDGWGDENNVSSSGGNPNTNTNSNTGNSGSLGTNGTGTGNSDSMGTGKQTTPANPTPGNTAPASSTEDNVTPSQSTGTNNNTVMGYSSYEDYLKAMGYLQNQSANLADYGYTGSLQPQIQSIMDSLLNQEKFSYDLNDDALYQQYRDRYIGQAQMSMKDTMGQAAALTGGYGSTYSQNAGQQAYDRTMQGLNDIVPELEQNAYSRYQDDITNRRNDLSMLMQADEEEYSKALTERSFADQEEDDAYNRWVNERAYSDEQRAQAMSDLTQWISLGYTPSADEIAAAGMNEEQYKLLVNSLKKSSGGSSKQTIDQYYAEQLAAAQAAGISDAAGWAALATANKYTGDTNLAMIDMLVQQTQIQNNKNQTQTGGSNGNSTKNINAANRFK